MLAVKRYKCSLQYMFCMKQGKEKYAEQFLRNNALSKQQMVQSDGEQTECIVTSFNEGSCNMKNGTSFPN